MNILSALRTEASKLERQLDSVNATIKALGGRNSVGRGRRKKRRVCKRESQNSEGANGAVGEDESREEECLSGTCASVDGCLALNTAINLPT